MVEQEGGGSGQNGRHGCAPGGPERLEDMVVTRDRGEGMWLDNPCAKIDVQALEEKDGWNRGSAMMSKKIFLAD